MLNDRTDDEIYERSIGVTRVSIKEQEGLSRRADGGAVAAPSSSLVWRGRRAVAATGHRRERVFLQGERVRDASHNEFIARGHPIPSAFSRINPKVRIKTGFSKFCDSGG